MQALARLHSLAAADLVADDQLGRPRLEPEVSARLDLMSRLVTGASTVPAPILAAVAHGGLPGRGARLCVRLGRRPDPLAGLQLPCPAGRGPRSAGDRRLEGSGGQDDVINTTSTHEAGDVPNEFGAPPASTDLGYQACNCGLCGMASAVLRCVSAADPTQGVVYVVRVSAITQAHNTSAISRLWLRVGAGIHAGQPGVGGRALLFRIDPGLTGLP